MGTNQNSLSKTQPDMTVDLLLDQFIESMNALQLQDSEMANQTLTIARNLYQQAIIGKKKADTTPLKIIVNLIEIPTRIIRSTYSLVEERYKKALDELVIAKQICDEVNLSMSQTAPHVFASKPFERLGDLFRFMFVYYESVVTATLAITKCTVDKSEGNYVDEAGIYLQAAADLRNASELKFELVNPESYNTILPLIRLLQKLADTYEKKAESAEDRKKQISFISPDDRKVFLVHGHNEAILQELKEMLKKLNVEAVILKNETDDGKTLIEKFEHFGRLCAFAFVLITPDDFVENNQKKYFQARPNVLFELGWFTGRYGRNKVRILQQKDTPLPSDLNGLVTIEFSENLKEVYRKIVAVLQNANIIQQKPQTKVAAKQKQG